jgi:hypothetical protein
LILNLSIQILKYTLNFSKVSELKRVVCCRKDLVHIPEKVDFGKFCQKKKEHHSGVFLGNILINKGKD